MTTSSFGNYNLSNVYAADVWNTLCKRMYTARKGAAEESSSKVLILKWARFYPRLACEVLT